MITVEGASADDVWRQAAARVCAAGERQEGRGGATKEVLHAAFTIADPRQRVVFARPINPAFAIAEVLWILAGANDSEFLAFWNPRMRQFTDDAAPHVFHGAYGYRLGHRPRLSPGAARALRHPAGRRAAGPDQLRRAVAALAESPASRQVVLQIWDAERDLPDPLPRSRDVPCNIASHLLLRDGRLEWLQVLRSNDLVWGLPYNIIQFTTLQEVVAGWLGVDVGTYTQVSDSLHTYERHWGALEAVTTDPVVVPRNGADLRIGPYEAWEEIFARLVDGALALTRASSAAALLDIGATLADQPPAYAEWAALLTAEALRRRGYGEEAARVISAAGPFWGASWRRWAASVAARNRSPEAA
ncbi:MAG TPA: thymidylate synthase [Thermomicrobiales bacterium]|nr:thymidylate synthase [Thermomicrobiales bacterium]